MDPVPGTGAPSGYPPATRHSSVARWIPFLFVLMTAALIGSVALPAAETSRIIATLDDVEHIVEPGRLVADRLESGIAEEAAELQEHARSRDAASLARFRAAMAEDGLLVDSLSGLVRGTAMPTPSDVATLVEMTRRWRMLIAEASREPWTDARFAATASRREALRDSIVLAIARVQSDLADQSARGRAAVAAHERRSLAVNAVLVVLSLIATAIVFDLTRRQHRRVRREEALRAVAETLAGAFTADEIAGAVARGAVDLFRARAACVGRVEPRSDGEPRVTATAMVGLDGDPGQADQVLDHPAVAGALRTSMPILVRDARSSRIIVPFGNADQPIGVAVVFESDTRRLAQDDLAWATIFGHFASLANENVRSLAEARDGRAQLERVMESRSRLMRGFSHDVKNPLGAADGYAALLEDGVYGEVNPEQRVSIERVRRAVQRALSLIDDLHELARAETGRLTVHVERTDLSILVHGMAEDYRAAASAKHLALIVDIEPRLPVVQTDPSRVRQIVGNFLSNAIKYTSSGSIVLRARCLAVSERDAEPEVSVDVVDTGPGIPAEERELIFDEFHRIAGTGQPGAGLGLAISARVADALGCRIRVESEVGKGSTFSLRVPASRDDRGCDPITGWPAGPEDRLAQRARSE